MNDLALLFCAWVAVLSAILAFTRRSLVHGGLMLVVAWMGIASLYFVMGAEFLALAQLLVYVGAVSMVVLFAVVMTRPLEAQSRPADGTTWLKVGGTLLCVAPVLGLLLAVIAGRPAAAMPESPAPTVKEIGLQLMEQHAAPLLLIGLLLTAALIGAVLLAAPQEEEDQS